MPKLIYHGHSCFEVKGKDGQIIIDPFLRENPTADISPEDVQCDAVLLSHGHGDHLGDALEIAKKCNALVVAPFELATFLLDKGAQTHPLHIGGGHQFRFGHVKLVLAAHGGQVAGDDGTHTTHAAGIILTMDRTVIYHAGDTGLLADMELLGRFYELDVALLPIGDNFTMGPDDAIIATQFLKPKLVIPMHYNTFDLIKQDPHKFMRRVEKETKIQCRVLEPGESLEV